MATETTETIVREAPNIEAYKLGLLESAKTLANRSVGVRVPQTDAQGNPVLDADGNPTYVQQEFEDAQGNIQTRDLKQLPRQQVAGQDALQTQAYNLAQQGVGGFQPYLTEAGYTMGDSAKTVDSVMPGAQPYQTTAGTMMADAATGIGAQTLAGQQGIANALARGSLDTGKSQSGLATAALGARTIANQGMSDQLAAYDAIPGQIAPAQQAMSQSGVMAQDVAQASRAGGLGAYQQALSGVNQVSDAANRLQAQTRQGSQAAAQQGIAALAGTAGAYDPTGADPFMNQFEDAAVQQAMQDIRRAGDIQQQSNRANAVSAGAFGGARSGILESEQNRNTLEQQARTAAQMRQAGFESAAARSQQSYEQQQGRAQQAAQAASQLGLTAEELSSKVGMQAQDLSQQGALQAAQTGLSAEQLASQTGLNAAQFTGQMAQSAGQLGLSAAQTQAEIANRAAAQGISAEQLTGQLAGQYGQLGQGQASMSLQGAQNAANLGLQGQEMYGRLGEGIGNLGAQYGQLGLQAGEAQGNAALRQASLGAEQQRMSQAEQGFLFDMGKSQQAQTQAELEADRQSDMAQLYEPYQRVGFLSDIYKGAPTSQQSITGATAPSVSTAQSVLGLGVAGLSAAAGASRAGLFG